MLFLLIIMPISQLFRIYDKFNAVTFVEYLKELHWKYGKIALILDRRPVAQLCIFFVIFLILCKFVHENLNHQRILKKLTRKFVPKNYCATYLEHQFTNQKK